MTIEHSVTNSSQIFHLSYDEIEQRLTITYHNGQKYAYMNVPRELFDKLIVAESAGKFLNSEIKGHFKYEKI